jgi:hypothetical protein
MVYPSSRTVFPANKASLFGVSPNLFLGREFLAELLVVFKQRVGHRSSSSNRTP